MRSLPVALAVVLASTSALANPAPVGSAGKAPTPLVVKDARQVRLVEETVVMTDGLVTELPSFDPKGPPMRAATVGYEGDYLLENLSEAPVTLRIGFPTVEGGMAAGGSIGGVDDFKVTARGQPLAVRDEKAVRARVYERSILLDRGLTQQTLDRLAQAKLVVPVEAEPTLVDIAGLGGKRKQVWAKLTALGLPADQLALLKPMVMDLPLAQDDFAIDGKLAWRSFEVKFGPRETVALRITYRSIRAWEGMDYEFGYVLRTGARWAGTVGRCRIVLRLAQRHTPDHYQVHPKPQLEGKDLVIDGKDFEPEVDVWVRKTSR